jgi:hypothetical protein
MDLPINSDDCLQESLDNNERQIKKHLLDCASALGPFVTDLMQSLWSDGLLSITEHASRILRLAQFYDPESLEAACRRALFYQKTDYLTVDRILRENLHTLPLNPNADVYGQLALWRSDSPD